MPARSRSLVSRSWPIKLATVLFSGGVAAMAITRAGLAGCGAAPSTPTPAIAPAAAPTVAPTPVQSAPRPEPIPPVAAPAANRETPPPELPRRYFGGSKSDVEMWVPDLPRPDPATPTKRGER